MERLTIPDKKIDGGWKRAFIDTEEVRKCAMSIYWALKKYEDTGLTPPEIMELKERDTAKEPYRERQNPCGVENSKIDVTMSLYFEIKGTEAFDGEKGYCESKINLYTNDLGGFILPEYAQKQIEGIAKLFEVPKENIRIISRDEYKANTEED